MPFMSELTIKRRISLIFAGSLAFALLTSMASFLVYERFALREGLVRDTRTQAQVISERLAADVEFSSFFSGSNAIRYLFNNKNILAARLYDRHGVPFITEGRLDPRLPLADVAPTEEIIQFGPESVDIFVRIYQNGDFKGTLLIRTSLDEITDRFALAVKVMSAVGTLLFLILILASRTFRNQISAPILDLASTARRITEERDYSIRLEKPQKGELRDLQSAFNDMLTQIQSRDAQLLNYQEHLEDQVAQRSEQLLKVNTQLMLARDRAEAASRSKSAFLANMSHELRTPLNAILLYSELLADELKERHQTDMVADLERIRSAGKHLLSLIDDILDLSKIEAGRMTIYLENVDLPALVKDVTTTIRPLAERNRNTLVVEMAPDITLLRTDVKMLRQTLSNLLDNASKFTTDGSIHLSIQHDGSDPAFLAIQVTDSGIGMTREQLGRVFDEFSQGDESTTRRFGGTGLGLALCRRFVDMLGGEMTVESEPGHGTCFHIRLPRMGERPIQAQVEPSSDAPTLPKVVVIDDDPAMRDALARMLARDGFWVHTASSGEEGLILARQHRPDIITLDIAMPEMDGWEVLQQLKGSPELEDIPVVLVTMMEGRSKGFAMGAAEFIQKPVSRESLIPVLRRIIRSHHSGPVLIVEDDGETLAGLNRILEQEGWETLQAGNGLEALERLTFSRPQAILLDLMLPGLDGFQLLMELQSHPDWSGIPVVVLTAKELTTEDRIALSTPQVREVFRKGAAGRIEIVEAVRKIARRRTPPPQDEKG